MRAWVVRHAGIGAAAIAVGLTLGSATALHAQTYPVEGTINFETGLRLLATITLVRDGATVIDHGAAVTWGDGSLPEWQRGWLTNCRGFLNRTCDVYGTHRYTSLGTFTIRIQYTSPGFFGGTPAEARTTATIRPVGDFVILSVGDSVASGEGNPAIPRTNVYEDTRPNPLGGSSLGLWDDPGSNYYNIPDTDPDYQACHRSPGSGPAMAAYHLRSTNPGSNITFLHVACSGAKINDGPVPSVIGQLRWARQRLEAARLLQGGATDGPPIDIDVLLISAGANDIAGGFGAIVERCLLNAFEPCSTDDVLRASLTASFEALPAEYETLAQEIAMPTTTRGTVSEVYLTEYFDPTREADGEFPGPLESLACTGSLVGPSEWEFLYYEMVAPLNSAVSEAAATHDWHLVNGIAEAFRPHGYCVQGDSWVVKVPESLHQQGDQNGTAHPNAPGQANYRDHILEAVFAFTPTRTTASGVTGGQPYVFGTTATEEVAVTLTASNPIGEAGVGKTFFSVDDPACAPKSVVPCSIYAGPILIDTSGEHVVTFFSQNLQGRLEQARSVVVRVEIAEIDPPTMNCRVTPRVLWPPNGRLVPVWTKVKALDGEGRRLPFVLTSVTVSNGNAERDIKGFVVGTPDRFGWLRARRSGLRHGREYKLAYEATDTHGSVAGCTLVVKVPGHPHRAKDPTPKAKSR